MKKLLTIILTVSAALFLAPIGAEAGGNSKKHKKHSVHKHHNHSYSVRSHSYRNYNNRVYRSPSHGHYRIPYVRVPRVQTYRSYGYSGPVVPFFVPRVSPGFSFHFGSGGYCR
ncbi:MAG: hypothetical protein P1U87_06485 [Verrucomicrobiales bacterium]|nr:hypothetical protein [Verrucomicrobiales bacterium]